MQLYSKSYDFDSNVHVGLYSNLQSNLAQHSSECQKFTCVYHSLFMNQYSCISLPQDPSMNPQAYPQNKLDFKYNAVFLRSTKGHCFCWSLISSVPVNLIRLSGRMFVLIWNEVKPLLTRAVLWLVI